ncbi:MAG: hypothetical protein DRN15_01505 [Thermoprotei archaeon]|nr:MAG: hypothetical protein DRN15_01505 [Thermoprotei archaeon]RLF25870.1 MAG: hypothetical protein DRM97_00400 [Thermoprotei archaeon]
MEFKEFGWRFTEMLVPKEWELAADGAGAKYAYFRLDDSFRPRLEVRWDRVEPKKAPSPRRNVEKFLSDIEKHFSKRLKRQYKLKRLGLREVKIANHEACMFHVRDESGNEVVGVSWYCPDTRRMFIVQGFTLGKEYSAFKKTFDKVLSSFVCHKKEPWLWNVYGLRFKTPEGYRLEGRNLRSPYARLTFSRNDFWFIVAYHGMANILFEEEYTSLLDWFRRMYVKDAFKPLGRTAIRTSYDIAVKGHHGLKIVSATRLSLFKKLIVDTYLWLCDRVNRIIVVSFAYPEKMYSAVKDEMNSLLDSVLCH